MNHKANNMKLMVFEVHKVIMIMKISSIIQITNNYNENHMINIQMMKFHVIAPLYEYE